MDVQTAITVASVGFGIGSFVMGVLVTRAQQAELKLFIQQQLRIEVDGIKQWTEARFQRKADATPGVEGARVLPG